MPSEALSQPTLGEAPGAGAITAAVSRGIVRLYSDLHGRGPTKARTYLEESHLICILEDVFTRAEVTLIAGGRGAQVAKMRAHLHDEIAPGLVRIVEAEVGRRVRACLGQVDVVTGIAVEFFCFEAGSAASDA